MHGCAVSWIGETAMDPERWRQIDALLQAALALPQDERVAFLHRECGNDAELFAEVSSLLSSDRQAESFLATPIVNLPAELCFESGLRPFIWWNLATATVLTGQMISHYRVLDRLGQRLAEWALFMKLRTSHSDAALR